VSAYLFYVDESYDSQFFCLSAICICHRFWDQCFNEVKSLRVTLKSSHGIYLRKEIHATDFVSGRGAVGTRTITKWERSRIYFELLQLVARLPQVFIVNVCLQRSSHPDPQMVAWDRLLNRVERTMRAFEEREMPRRRYLSSVVNPHLSSLDANDVERRLLAYQPRAIIFADKCRESEITQARRRMGVFNPVPSQFRRWGSGASAKNIPLQRIIEDPVFKDSTRSYFLQLADCVAFALLKRETPPTPLVRKYGINRMFDRALAGVCFRAASARDPLGVVRS
jgi:Protein of unknown function (DUF3800)